MFDLANLTPSDLVVCGSDLRQATAAATTPDEAARALAHHLRAAFRDPVTERAQLSLVRVYVTARDTAARPGLTGHAAPGAEQGTGEDGADGADLGGRVLELLGSDGAAPGPGHPGAPERVRLPAPATAPAPTPASSPRADWTAGPSDGPGAALPRIPEPLSPPGPFPPTGTGEPPWVHAAALTEPPTADTVDWTPPVPDVTSSGSWATGPAAGAVPQPPAPGGFRPDPRAASTELPQPSRDPGTAAPSAQGRPAEGTNGVGSPGGPPHAQPTPAPVPRPPSTPAQGTTNGVAPPGNSPQAGMTPGWGHVPVTAGPTSGAPDTGIPQPPAGGSSSPAAEGPTPGAPPGPASAGVSPDSAARTDAGEMGVTAAGSAPAPVGIPQPPSLGGSALPAVEGPTPGPPPPGHASAGTSADSAAWPAAGTVDMTIAGSGPVPLGIPRPPRAGGDSAAAGRTWAEAPAAAGPIGDPSTESTGWGAEHPTRPDDAAPGVPTPIAQPPRPGEDSAPVGPTWADVPAAGPSGDAPGVSTTGIPQPPRPVGDVDPVGPTSADLPAAASPIGAASADSTGWGAEDPTRRADAAPGLPIAGIPQPLPPAPPAAAVSPRAEVPAAGPRFAPSVPWADDDVVPPTEGVTAFSASVGARPLGAAGGDGALHPAFEAVLRQLGVLGAPAAPGGGGGGGLPVPVAGGAGPGGMSGTGAYPATFAGAPRVGAASGTSGGPAPVAIPGPTPGSLPGVSAVTGTATVAATSADLVAGTVTGLPPGLGPGPVAGGPGGGGTVSGVPLRGAYAVPAPPPAVVLPGPTSPAASSPVVPSVLSAPSGGPAPLAEASQDGACDVESDRYAIAHIPDPHTGLHGVRTVLGYAGTLPDGEVFAVVLFTGRHIPAPAAELLRSLAAASRLALLPAPATPAPTPRDGMLAAARLDALEQLLAATEDTTVEQARTVATYRGRVRTQAEQLRLKQQRLEQETNIVETLYRVGQQLTSGLDLDAVVQTATDAATKVIVAEHGLLLYRDADCEAGAEGADGIRFAVSSRASAAHPLLPDPMVRLTGAHVAASVVRCGDLADYPGRGHQAPVAWSPDALPVRSYMAVPVVSRGGEPLGSFAFSHSKPDIFTERDEQLALGIAAQAASAIENARLYRRERDTAVRLQRSLLPPELPDIDTLEVACRYLPGARGTQVGGDWFDVIPLSAGRVALVIGDVMGRGLSAAAVMGQLRVAVRAYAVMDLPPAQVMRHLNRLLAGMGSDEQITTCVYAVYDPGHAAIRWSNAGHLPPALVSADGEVRLLDDDLGVPLGVEGTAFEDAEIAFTAADRLLLYTDGLVERHDASLTDRLRAFTGHMAAHMGGAARHRDGVQDACDRLLGSMLTGREHDDVALLLVRACGVRERSGSLELPPSPRAAREARSFTRGTLARWGLDGLVDAACSVVTELVANAVEHARTPMELRLRHRSGRLVVQVADHDGRLPRRITAAEGDERHRGLMIVAALAADWGVRPTDAGKVVWAELTDRA
ncbi:ATP-binding SpoIIE family protein phosphatase [Yinghuangia seranimata]|uniref:ATP-binding SpoIIE family protein phosphatase n=1 Tax=Yinghuangia seranimata TaxID=408067 RepID=UPI00248CDA1C|nr:SpoIIE family protein phosphatase [Yinghuangia seranimata]MDI2129178.1 SpoIIE family protein phosphatase [Yinghuangia seranimata]